jgi:hypothetical protein
MLRFKEQETRLNHHEHDDDDNDDVFVSYRRLFFTLMAQITQRCNTTMTLRNVPIRTETYKNFRYCQCRDTGREPVKEGNLFATRFCEYCVSQYAFCCSATSVQYT